MMLLLSCAPRIPPSAAPSTDPSYADAIFMATHNSYSGGSRGSLEEQLVHGVRFFELDIHDDELATRGVFSIGHDAPGDEVLLGSGNPQETDLETWLQALRGWLEAHPASAPLTIGIDVKDELDLDELAALDVLLIRCLADRLYRSEEHRGSWPALAALAGRALVVLSGHEPTRLAYLQRTGPAFVEHQPAKDRVIGPDDAWFYAARAAGRHSVDEWRAAGRIVRLWRFNRPAHQRLASPDFPATDVPFQAWYVSYAERVGVAR